MGRRRGTRRLLRLQQSCLPGRTTARRSRPQGRAPRRGPGDRQRRRGGGGGPGRALGARTRRLAGHLLARGRGGGHLGDIRGRPEHAGPPAAYRRRAGSARHQRRRDTARHRRRRGRCHAHRRHRCVGGWDPRPAPRRLPDRFRRDVARLGSRRRGPGSLSVPDVRGTERVAVPSLREPHGPRRRGGMAEQRRSEPGRQRRRGRRRLGWRGSGSVPVPDPGGRLRRRRTHRHRPIRRPDRHLGRPRAPPSAWSAPGSTRRRSKSRATSRSGPPPGASTWTAAVSRPW